ncbi:MAG: glycogen debranching protein GlgX [Gammaproteobacteria bacterium]|nr:glycogen debranching protein GlgX [Gammaproteobacteria bacterium]
MRLTNGMPYPLGATVTPIGVNFALFSAHASAVELCLFDPQSDELIASFKLVARSEDIWHGMVEGLTVGAHYGYRVYGPYEPNNGHRFNPNKLLLDPYAKALSQSFFYHPSWQGHQVNQVFDDAAMDQQDSASYVPKAIVTAAETDAQKGVAPLLNDIDKSEEDLIIYELNVRTFSAANQHINQPLRGTLAALTEAKTLDYLTALGVSAVELMPIAACVDETRLTKQKMRNVWGYNSINFFSLEPRLYQYKSAQNFVCLVKALAQRGIRLILDMVFNHTAEGDSNGPTLSFRGIDNKSYYVLEKDNLREYENFSGCGNTLNTEHPQVIQMILDCLRYWCRLGVAGFRFDLAVALGRNYLSCNRDKFAAQADFSRYHPLFSAIHQDPVLKNVLLIAEPWDLGANGYQLGQFPSAWHEWNDQFRNTVRRFWRADQGMTGAFAACLQGSYDKFSRGNRKARNSVNFVTAHDGFCLTDLVSYNKKHNEANGENGVDGCSANFSFNYGVEGATECSEINDLRARQKRNFMLTLMLAQGTPMLLAGDERSHTQQGNNNPYCQDNSITHLNWNNLSEEQESFLDFVQHLIALRKSHPSLKRTRFMHGDRLFDTHPIKDISWWHSSGVEMAESHWNEAELKCFGLLLCSAHSLNTTESGGKQIAGILLLFNAATTPNQFLLPPFTRQWQLLINTDTTAITKQEYTAAEIRIAQRSAVVLSFKQQIDKRAA